MFHLDATCNSLSRAKSHVPRTASGRHTATAAAALCTVQDAAKAARAARLHLRCCASRYILSTSPLFGCLSANTTPAARRDVPCPAAPLQRRQIMRFLHPVSVISNPSGLLTGADLALFLSGVNVALATRVTLARPRSRGSRHRSAAALPPRRTRRRPRRRAVRGGAVRLGGRGAVVCGPRNSRRLLSTRQGFGLCLMALPIGTLTQVIPQDGAINREWVPCSAKAIER